MVGLLLAAWALRLPPLLRTPVHPDEALYGYWGMCIGENRDPWLIHTPVDKPPLLLYIVAGSQLIFGSQELGLRLPGLAGGLLMVPLASALANALYGDRLTTAFAALGVALSPLAVVLSGTAFPDPVMIALGVAGCVAATRNRPAWAGVLSGLSFAAKQSGLVWLPLSALLLVLCHRIKRKNRAMLSFAGCSALVVGLVFAWDAVRLLQGAGSYWQAGVSGYGGLRLIWPQELWPRLERWLRAGRHLFASASVNTLVLAGIPALVWPGILNRRGRERVLADAVLVSFLLMYGILHWLVAFPVWVRYLFAPLPVLAVILGRIARRAFVWVGSGARWIQVVVAAMLAAFLVGPAVEASAGRHPVAQEHSRYAGIDDVSSFLAQRAEGTVVYHHWLGWHYGYGLWEAPVYLAYWPNPKWLAGDVKAFGQSGPRFIAFPAWESSARVEGHLADIGHVLVLRSVVRDEGQAALRVYELVPSEDR